MSLFPIVAGNLAGKNWGRKFARQRWRFPAKMWRFGSFGTWSHCSKQILTDLTDFLQFEDFLKNSDDENGSGIKGRKVTNVEEPETLWGLDTDSLRS